MSLNTRTERLRSMVLDMPAICTDRAVYMTDSYKETEGKPDIIRRAESLKKILCNMRVHIEEGELLAGWETGKFRACALVPEVDAQWLLDEMDTVSTRHYDKYKALTEDEKNTLRDVLGYWHNKCVGDKMRAAVPEEFRKIDHLVATSMGFSENGHNFAHVAADYSLLLEKGLVKLGDEIKAKRDALDIAKLENVHKRHFMDAVLICYDAVIAYANRYAELAEQQAETASPERKAELLRLAEICRKVPAGPAETFYEAIQSSWFLYVALMNEGWGAGMTFGRADQLWYPYYKKDIESGRITKEQAHELLCCLFIKMNGAVNPQSNIVSAVMSGSPLMQSLTVGGILPNGEDAINEMSYLLLDAEADVSLVMDDVVVRVNQKNPDQFLQYAGKAARKLRGKLKFVNDDITIKGMVVDGIPIEYARDYISTGCHNPTVPAVTHDMGGVSLNYPFILELALNNGVSRVTGQQIGPKTGDPRNFSSFGQVLDAFRAQFRAMVNIMFFFENTDLTLFSSLPTPLLSSFYHGCLDRGLDINEGGAYRRTHTIGISGAPNVGDSLEAIRELVFVDKKLTMSRLMDALDANFEGYDDVLALIQKTPKFGNNKPEVDLLLRATLAESCDYIRSHTTFAGGVSGAGCITMTANMPFGAVLGATPDGRKAGEPISEGGISPHQGRNVSGITSTMASVAALDQIKLSHGSILNVRISAECVKDEPSLKKFASLIRTFCDLGGDLVQFNFVDNETLRDAQRHPENYRDLLVRVATYSAYFVELSPELQEDIIARNEFAI